MYLGRDRRPGCGRGGQRDRRLAAVSPPHTCHVSPVWSTGKTDTHARGALPRPTSPSSGSLTGRGAIRVVHGCMSMYR